MKELPIFHQLCCSHLWSCGCGLPLLMVAGSSYHDSLTPYSRNMTITSFSHTNMGDIKLDFKTVTLPIEGVFKVTSLAEVYDYIVSRTTCNSKASSIY